MIASFLTELETNNVRLYPKKHLPQIPLQNRHIKTPPKATKTGLQERTVPRGVLCAYFIFECRRSVFKAQIQAPAKNAHRERQNGMVLFLVSAAPCLVAALVLYLASRVCSCGSGFNSLNMINFNNCDCMDFMQTVPDKYYDLAIVDPPYGLGDSVVNSGGRFKRYENKNGNWDVSTPDYNYFEQLFRVSKNQIIWGGNYFDLPPSKCFIIWDKLQPEGVSFSMCEYAWASFDKVAKIFKRRTIGQEQRFHPTQKPVALYKWLLTNYAKTGDKILDTHGGSGSIAIACHDLKFDLDICELDKDYFDAMQKRFNNHIAQTTLF